MTYQESFATALRLKNYVRLYDKQAWIYFIFTSETDFTVTVFDTEPSDEVKDRIFHEAISRNRLPMAAVFMSDEIETFSFRTPDITVQLDLADDSIIYFEGEESAPVDINKVRKSFRELIGKLK